ncbi:metal ABC transporter substrate-binding protein [Blautia obeum]|uniref:High-affinity zinc uptake system binding-protein ZnuA n=1 Tax=Blautia obeum TaxID=40520 RepID=A0A564S6I9_9FIRM|nr:metal ABC transporter substrate-binding protein [Blautia obeum]VUW90689.1 High-affinity zinc uptake system binding-protein ZnuA precursor [Blautia obeum]
MKKWITGALAILLGVMSIAVPFSGMHIVEAKTTEETDRKLNIVTTIFPEYDWTRNILGNREADVNLTMLLDNGTDLHSFQPAVKDIMKVSSCDLLIYVGGESDQWIEDALESAQNKDMKTINLMEVLGDTIKEEETVEGMQDSEHEHGHEDEHAHEGEDEKEYDEHVWTSMRNASVICDAIAETLEEMDPENKEIYQTNAENYKAKLSTLDQKYQETVDTDRQNTLIFADRFAFRYLVDDYGLNYYAAFSGCSAESEASFKTVTFLAGKLDELGIKTVLTIEKSDDRIAQTVIENTKKKDQKILELNSMQSITSDEIKNGVTYLSVMEDNLKVLKEALK